MIPKETLREIVKTQRQSLALFEKGIGREEMKRLQIDLPFANVISGIRRCGKSTILRQIMAKTKGFYYFTFEDSRVVGFELADFERLNAVFLEEYGEQDYYFFDEVQNVPQWELFVRTMLDRKKHFVITGSNASLLSKELGTRLTGRHLDHELFPFSYREFLKFTNQEPGIKSFEEYAVKGGFPEYLRWGRADVLQNLLNDILNRDILLRHKIRNTKVLRELAVYLLTNVGKEFSYNTLKNLFNLGSINTAISFISYLEDAYLLFTISKFDYSLKKQIINPKKVYSIDNGLSITNSASFSADKGQMLENLAFISLRKKYKEIFYFKEGNECDFVIKEGTKITKAFQVCSILHAENQEREVNGLLEAMEKFKLKEGIILTAHQEDKYVIKGKVIKAIPIWKWLLE